MKILKTSGIILGLLMLFMVGFGMYLNRDLPHEIKPATFNCMALDQGSFVPFDSIATNNIYGIGLAYAKHINETASDFDPQGDPPVFIKARNSMIGDGGLVAIPSHATMLAALESLEPGLGEKVNQQFPALPALLDYEVEMGFVLLEDIEAKDLQNVNHVPQIGFFMANDFGARSLAVLGEGQPNRYDYWGLSKSFPGFTPISDQVWIPNQATANAIPCITIETQVNGEVRQRQNTSDLIYTPSQMLQAIHRKYPERPLRKGDLILTGTPGGVMMNAPRWLMRLAAMVGMDRFAKLTNVTDPENAARFLMPGDRVLVKGEGLGRVEVVVE